MKTTRSTERRQQNSEIKVISPHSIGRAAINNKNKQPIQKNDEKLNLISVIKNKSNVVAEQINLKEKSSTAVTKENSKSTSKKSKVNESVSMEATAKLPTKLSAISIAKVELKKTTQLTKTTNVETNLGNKLQKKAIHNVDQPSGKPKLINKCVSAASISSKSNSNKPFPCNLCDRAFSSKAYLDIHIEYHKDNFSSTTTEDVVILNKAITSKQTYKKLSPDLDTYQKQIKLQRNALEKVEEQVQRSTVLQKTIEKKKIGKRLQGKKSKLSPTKLLLREQLKIQLEAQQELLRVQQQIFEKANKAQSDIFKLIAELGVDDEDDDDDDDGELDEIELQEANEKHVEQEQRTNEINVNLNILKPSEVYQKIGWNGKEEDDKQIVLEEIEMGAEGVQSYILVDEAAKKDADPQNGDIIDPDADQNVVVVVQSEEGVEEFELFEVYEDDEYKPIQDNNVNDPIADDFYHFEIVEGENENIHCRIVTNDDKVQEPPEKHQNKNENKLPVPIKVDLNNVNIPPPRRAIDEKTNLKAAEKKSNDLLNKTKKTVKETNEYIQKIVQEAVPNDENKFMCPICNELVSNRYSLGPHILRVHSKQKSKICTYCDRAFTCTGDLTRHIRIHTGSKPFKCSFPDCKYAFRASGDLYKHLRRHKTEENIRRHICDVCSRGFERNYDLKRHKLTHSKNEDGVGYKCEYCPKQFVRKDQHKAHTYRHLGIKPYKCPDCDRLFGDFSNCSKHIRQKDCKRKEDLANQFSCDICSKTFKSKMGIKLHVVKCSEQLSRQRDLQQVAGN